MLFTLTKKQKGTIDNNILVRYFTLTRHGKHILPLRLDATVSKARYNRAATTTPVLDPHRQSHPDTLNILLPAIQ